MGAIKWAAWTDWSDSKYKQLFMRVKPNVSEIWQPTMRTTVANNMNSNVEKQKDMNTKITTKEAVYIGVSLTWSSTQLAVEVSANNSGR